MSLNIARTLSLTNRLSAFTCSRYDQITHESTISRIVNSSFVLRLNETVDDTRENVRGDFPAKIKRRAPSQTDGSAVPLPLRLLS